MMNISSGWKLMNLASFPQYSAFSVLKEIKTIYYYTKLVVEAFNCLGK